MGGMEQIWVNLPGFPQIQLSKEDEAAMCEQVAELELSGNPADHLIASDLRSRYDLDDVWIEDAKADKLMRESK